MEGSHNCRHLRPLSEDLKETESFFVDGRKSCQVVR